MVHRDFEFTSFKEVAFEALSGHKKFGPGELRGFHSVKDLGCRAGLGLKM